jgi:Tol biopolymer transport system component
MHINWDNLYDKPVMEVWDQEGSILWKVSYQPDWEPFGGPRRSMTIYGWSPDSSKLYFYYSLQYDSGAPTFAFVRDLQSLDIATGKIKFILPLSRDEPTAFAFSPDMSKIAYISGSKVAILDLNTGSDKSTKILTDNSDDAG